MKIIYKSLLIWAAIIPLAIINGIFREAALNLVMSAYAAMVVSGILLSLFIIALTIIFIPKIGRTDAATYIKMGLVWILATVVFEFAFGFAGGEEFSQMIKAYDITTGNLWLLVVLTTGASPWIAAKARKII